MKSPLHFALILVVLGFLLLGFAFLFECEDDWCFVFDWQRVRSADSFERCVALGFPVMESYPRRCAAGDKSFTETVDTPVTEEKVRVTAPAANAVVKSPLTVTGSARGPWYFEASFPVRLYDALGNELAAVPAQAKGEWMTIEYVPFEATLSFKTPATATGTLVFEKDNPSGLPEHADSVSIPVRFK